MLKTGDGVLLNVQESLKYFEMEKKAKEENAKAKKK